MENKDLLRNNKDQVYKTFDLETEGLNLIYSRPWEMAINTYVDGKVVNESRRLIYWEDLNLSDFVKKLTGFSQKEYDDKAEPPEVVLEDLEKDLMNEENIIVGQNLLGYDIYIHQVWRRLVGLDTDYSYIDRILDTRALAIAWKKDITKAPECPKKRLAWQFKLISGQRNNRKIKVSQNQLLKDFNIPFDEKLLHQALYDVEKCQEIFQKLLWKIEV